MTYIITYKTGTSQNIKLAQIEAEDINEAYDKVHDLFLTYETIGSRKYELVNIKKLSEIRKLDALD